MKAINLQNRTKCLTALFTNRHFTSIMWRAVLLSLLWGYSVPLFCSCCSHPGCLGSSATGKATPRISAISFHTFTATLSAAILEHTSKTRLVSKSCLQRLLIKDLGLDLGLGN